MTISPRFRIVLLLTMVLAAVAIPMRSSLAKDDGSRTRMTASLSGVKAVARYEERGTRRKFNFQIELAIPGQVGNVTAVAANGAVVSMGSFTVNALRRGIIDIDTAEGNNVADLNVGSRISLILGGNTYTGTLR